MKRNLVRCNDKKNVKKYFFLFTVDIGYQAQNSL